MGRELRRVPLDFNWPYSKVWEGYLNPHRKACPEGLKNNCHGGYSNAGKWLDAVSQILALMGQEALVPPEDQALIKERGRTYPHPYLEELNYAPRTETPDEVLDHIRALPTQQEKNWALHCYHQEHPSQLLALDKELVDLVQKLAPGQALGSFGGGVAYEIGRTLMKAAGVDPHTWGLCKVCGGDGMDPAVKEAKEAWEPTPPPTGEGWQLWETTSEGSPISPVFDTEEAFVQHLIGKGYTETAARKFVVTGHACSMVMAGGKMYKDIEACDLD